jgi:hypothetical protein
MQANNETGIRREMVSVENFKFGIETRSALDKPKLSVLVAYSRADRLFFMTKELHFWLLKCSAGVSPAIVSRSMAGGTPALQ